MNGKRKRRTGGLTSNSVRQCHRGKVHKYIVCHHRACACFVPGHGDLARLGHGLGDVLGGINGILNQTLKERHLDRLSDGVRNGELDHVVSSMLQRDNVVVNPMGEKIMSNTEKVSIDVSGSQSAFVLAKSPVGHFIPWLILRIVVI